VLAVHKKNPIENSKLKIVENLTGQYEKAGKKFGK